MVSCACGQGDQGSSFVSVLLSHVSFNTDSQNPCSPSGPGSSWLRMEAINRGGSQLEQRLPCCGLCAGERVWEAVAILCLGALSKVVICVAVLTLYLLPPVVCQRNMQKKVILSI